METPCLFLDLHVNILLSMKTLTVIFWNYHWRAQMQFISDTDLWTITNDNSDTSFSSARTTLVEVGVGSICFRVTLPAFEYEMWFSGTWERERKREIWQKIDKTVVFSLMWKPNQIPSRHLVLLKEKLIIHCSKQTFPSGLSLAVQILLGTHILDTSSQNSQYYFSNIWMD